MIESRQVHSDRWNHPDHPGVRDHCSKQMVTLVGVVKWRLPASSTFLPNQTSNVHNTDQLTLVNHSRY